MICPVCNIGMVVLEFEGVELDHCMECNGVWFDRDELDYLLESFKLNVKSFEMKASKFLEIARKKEKARRCPRCRGKMKKVSVEGDPPIIIDRCDVHGGYWFDGGELTGVISRGAAEEDWKRVTDFLGSLLSFKNIEREEPQL
ncbi:MAG: zf-TFIIB domain-containing protein [bacterium]